MPFLRQSTAQTIRFGPCLDKTDGVTEETALTLAQADMRLSKDGGAFAQKSAAGNATHDSDGWYSTSLSTTDTDTVGELILNVHQPANMLPIWPRWWVMEEAIYDAIFGASAAGFDSNQRVDVGKWLGTAAATPTVAGVPEVDLTHLGGVVQSATDLKDFADAGYDPATNKVQGVVLVDTTTTNTDVRGTDNAALASVCTEGRLAELDAANLPSTTNDILTDTAVIGALGVGLTDLGGMSTGMKAEVESEVTDSLVVHNLDHLCLTATAAADMTVEVADNTIISRMLANGDTSLFDPSTDGLQPIRDRGDAAWTTGAGGSDRLLMVDTTIATLASQTSFTLTAGSADDDAYNNCTIVIEDVSTSTQKAVGLISDYTGATKTVTLKYDPAIFTMAATDKVYILAENALKSTAANRQLDVTATGAAGIDWGNVENPTTAVDLSATDVQLCDTVTTNTDMVGTDSAFLASSAPTNFGDLSIEATTGEVRTKQVLEDTTIATLASQTSFTLTAGSADDDAYNGCEIVIQDVTTATQKAVGVISDYTGSTKTVTLQEDPGIFTMATTDKVTIVGSRSLKPTVLNRTLDVASTGEAGVDLGNVTGVLGNANVGWVDANDRVDVGSWIGTAVTISSTTAKPEVDVNSISDSSDAADKLEASAETIETGAATATTLSTTQMSTNLTEATDDHYIGRIVIWTSGVLLRQATDITDYVGSTKTLTFTAVTEAPADGDSFVVV